jgi:hypothetical protein
VKLYYIEPGIKMVESKNKGIFPKEDIGGFKIKTLL